VLFRFGSRCLPFRESRLKRTLIRVPLFDALENLLLQYVGSREDNQGRSQLCRLPSSSRGEWLVKPPTGNHGEVHSKQEFDAKTSCPVEARMQKETE
jgi:hypothetical protein